MPIYLPAGRPVDIMATIKTKEEIEILREGGSRLAKVLKNISEKIKPGISTLEFDRLAENQIYSLGGRPSFKGYQGQKDRRPFPASLCLSLNDEVVHGLPLKNRFLKEGDIVSFDLGMEYRGLFTDIAATFPVGKIDSRAEKMIRVAKKALDKGIGAVRVGVFTGDIGWAIEDYVEGSGFKVVRQLVGHGVGRAVHEEPDVPNWGQPKTGAKLLEGMVLALEPMLTEGSPDVFLDKDGWTWKTKDGSRAVHFEHTILVTKKGAEVLTSL